MKVDQATFAGHRAALLDAAGRLFRGRGLAGVSVVDISRAAGLTHGAFYGHYASKDALAAAACRASLRDSAARWRARAEAAPDDPLGAIIDGYLTEAHRDAPADGGCALAALGTEMGRAGGDAADALDEGTRGLLEVLTEALGGSDRSAEAAFGILAAMTGGLALARALKPDPARSTEALLAARRAARRLIPTCAPPPHAPPTHVSGTD